MKKILVYSHDTYGLGNLRRMLAISQALQTTIPDISILLLSGSPMVHGFRLTAGMDYIKLPCLTRTQRDGYEAKFLRTDLQATMRLRSDLILAAAKNFQPDIFLVDKKPFGVKNELQAALEYLREVHPQMKAALILRDILDAPEATMSVWQAHDYFAVIEKFYVQVLVLGSPEIFDPREEYQFPAGVAGKVKFCGYTRRAVGTKTPEQIRAELQLVPEQRLVVATLGGGEDAYEVIAKYLEGLAQLPRANNLHSLIVTGPEMKPAQREVLRARAATLAHITMLEFTDDLMSYLGAADAVLSMGGYNTICEILSLGKKAVVIPRVRPVQEQLIRAERMSALGLLDYLHPDELTPQLLMQKLFAQLDAPPQPAPALPLNAHQEIAKGVISLFNE